MPQNFMLFVLLGVFAVMLFVQSRNRRKQAATMAASLEPGCEVVLTSGIYATVEAIADDRLIVSTAGSTKLEIARGAVVRITKSAADNKPKATPSTSKTAAAKTTAKSPAKTPSTKTGAAKSPAKANAKEAKK